MNNIMFPDGVPFTPEPLTGPVFEPSPAIEWKEASDGLSTYWVAKCPTCDGTLMARKFHVVGATDLREWHDATLWISVFHKDNRPEGCRQYNKVEAKVKAIYNGGSPYYRYDKVSEGINNELQKEITK